MRRRQRPGEMLRFPGAADARPASASGAWRNASTRTQDGLAFRDPGNPEHRRRADQARQALGRAREIERKYSGSWPGDFWITPRGVMPGKVICGTLDSERGLGVVRRHGKIRTGCREGSGGHHRGGQRLGGAAGRFRL